MNLKYEPPCSKFAFILFMINHFISGILRKEDLNAAQFRKIREEFEELNLGKLAKGKEAFKRTCIKDKNL